ncbi:MAG: 5-methyltetrahydrofolate--homocysteine methyltransferase [SAR202 cluster bacterium]|jgi:5-methyltetrahydrofolate--homocysteine methyltransferase|nr:5-methyltetrahydrofolate--homocysteine methyltransferase [SAR202 cluster bacterium]MQF94007.1 5-methyltetrahydrofolate--homocysteine methyltransferase [SAR202 cluster bacterium]|tara:strand:+ start:2841 stop:3764 length:924 start_codon:yes stop_codon:yes gene_type:complete
MVQKLKESSNKILQDINQGKIFLMDAATGTFLQNNGLEAGGCPELMNIESPEIISKMAHNYFSSGSDIVLTNTFGGTYYRLKHYGLEDKVIEINKLAAEIAKNASKDYENKYVFGSIGPTGEFIEPLGNVSESEMYDCLYNQMLGLYEGGVDGFVIETQIATEETLLALRVAKENFNILNIVSLVFDKGPKGYFTMFGLSPKQSIQMFFDSGADIVGTNCGNGSERMIEIMQEFRAETKKPILVQANAGIPIIKKNDIIYPESPEFMMEQYEKLIDLGVSILGGCCGTTEKHIFEFSKIIRSHNESI